MLRSAILGSLVLVLVWLVVTTGGLISPLFLPSPVAVARELASLASDTGLWFDAWATLGRTLAGFLLGATVGVTAGLLMGSYRRFYEVMEFPVDFFRSIPATAMFPLFIVIWGLGDDVKIFTVAWSSSMMFMISTVHGMRAVPEIRLRVVKIKRIGFVSSLWKVMIPDALPYIVAGGRVALSISIVIEIVAEMFLGSQSGLGRRIYNATSIFEMEEAYATILVVGIIGYLLNQAVLLLQRRYVHWAAAAKI